jgi:lipopolysaccharide transport system ATP-binding protein
MVDEVLAVGDAAFQRKCLGKMSRVAGEGRTILFVSHNMTAVQALCDRVIWLRGGQVVANGPPAQVVGQYLQPSAENLTARLWPDPDTAPGNDRVRLRLAHVRPLAGGSTDAITVRTPFALEFEYWSRRLQSPLTLSVHLFNQEGTLIFNVGPATPADPDETAPGLFRDTCTVPGDLLNDGTHRVELCVNLGDEVVFRYEDALVFDVHDSADLRGTWFGKWAGAVRPLLDWRTERLDERAAPLPEARAV